MRGGQILRRKVIKTKILGIFASGPDFCNHGKNAVGIFPGWGKLSTGHGALIAYISIHHTWSKLPTESYRKYGNSRERTIYSPNLTFWFQKYFQNDFSANSLITVSFPAFSNTLNSTILCIICSTPALREIKLWMWKKQFFERKKFHPYLRDLNRRRKKGQRSVSLTGKLTELVWRWHHRFTDGCPARERWPSHCGVRAASLLPSRSLSSYFPPLPCRRPASHIHWPSHPQYRCRTHLPCRGSNFKKI